MSDARFAFVNAQGKEGVFNYPFDMIVEFWVEDVELQRSYGEDWEVFDYQFFLSQWLPEWIVDTYYFYDFPDAPSGRVKLKDYEGITEYKFRCLVGLDAEGNHFVRPGPGQQDLFSV